LPTPLISVLIILSFSWLEHKGSKGGSIGSILMEALYTTDKKGNTTELAYFLDNLERLEMKVISKQYE